ncbi:hypothetical protein [Pseudoxanthomonas suwonensis]|uniref:DUF4124 domain-containing protein n=1 Tax=Pseudoxanthomonas suwonensis TaxID=314722 RepID=A0A0E3UMM7_9GAMM|nr:hypothetical protein [Pseudoxanthomonas suwonensis]AKC86175.1 hypothetical protein WQ53_04685 [Pseudoxanthomonas suwonensis]
MCRFLLLLSGTLLVSLPASAHAQPVQRCIGPDGRAVYTDRRCDDIGAVERLPPAAAGEGPRLFRGGCPHLLSQLVGEIGAAIQGRDVNRLASVYDWSGVSNASAGRLLDRLEGIVQRPLVDIAPVYGGDVGVAAATGPAPAPMAAAPADDSPPPTGPDAWMPSWSGRMRSAVPADGADAVADAGPDAGTLPAPPPAPARPRPVALRIEQTLAGGTTPTRTVFGLRRHYGCFWITL